MPSMRRTDLTTETLCFSGQFVAKLVGHDGAAQTGPVTTTCVMLLLLCGVTLKRHASRHLFPAAAGRSCLTLDRRCWPRLDAGQSTRRYTDLQGLKRRLDSRQREPNIICSS